MVKRDGSPEVKESHLTRAASDRSTDASVAALSETVADLSRQIAQAVIALALSGKDVDSVRSSATFSVSRTRLGISCSPEFPRIMKFGTGSV